MTGAAATRASAQQKISQAIAKYQDHPNDNQQCDGCIQFQASKVYKIVDGTINPKGWCQFFGAKANSLQETQAERLVHDKAIDSLYRHSRSGDEAMRAASSSAA